MLAYAEVLVYLNGMNQTPPKCVAGCLLLIAMMLVHATAWAAQDGDPGPTSIGTLSLRLEVAQGIQISNLRDITLVIRREPGIGDFTVDQEFCISGSVNSQFALTAFTLDEPERFTLRSATGELIPFSLLFTPQTSSQQFDAIQPNEPSNRYSVSSFDSCNAGNNAQIRVVFSEADVLASASLEFVGDLFLTIELQ